MHEISSKINRMKEREDLTLQEIHNAGLEVLKEIKRVADLIGVRWYLAYGTLLGGIRHNGFIPWDDDIDIHMMRSDYIVFLNEFNNICSSQFKLLSERDRDYPFMCPKVVNLNTYVIEKHMNQVKDLGVWVDVFPLDYVTADSLHHSNEILKLCKKSWIARYYISPPLTKLKYFLGGLIQPSTSFRDIESRPSDILAEISRLSHVTDRPTSILRCPVDVTSIFQFFNTSDFAEPIMCNFEGDQFPMPSGYDNILKTLYGDYMTPPPQNKVSKFGHLAASGWKN